MLNIMSHFSSARLIKMLAFSPKKYDILNLRQLGNSTLEMVQCDPNVIKYNALRIGVWRAVPFRIHFLIRFWSDDNLFSIENANINTLP